MCTSAENDARGLIRKCHPKMWPDQTDPPPHGPLNPAEPGWPQAELELATRLITSRIKGTRVDASRKTIQYPCKQMPGP